MRHLEGLFDRVSGVRGEEGGCRDLPDQHQLVEWLHSFQEIQGELTACLACLEDGAGEIDGLGRPAGSRSATSSPSSSSEAPAPVEERVTTIDEQQEVRHMDEVFEAFIGSSDLPAAALGFEDNFASREEQRREEDTRKHSKKVARNPNIANSFSSLSSTFSSSLSSLSRCCGS